MEETRYGLTGLADICSNLAAEEERRVPVTTEVGNHELGDLKRRLACSGRSIEFDWLAGRTLAVKCVLTDNVDNALHEQNRIDTLCDNVRARFTNSPGVLTLTAEDLGATHEELYAVYVRLLSRDYDCDWKLGKNGQHRLTVFY